MCRFPIDRRGGLLYDSWYKFGEYREAGDGGRGLQRNTGRMPDAQTQCRPQNVGRALRFLAFSALPETRMGWSCREEWDMEIRRLNQKDYAGRKFTARYQTNGYYEICASEQGFRLSYRLFPAPVGRSFDDVFFGEWLEAPAAFGAFDSDRLVGFAEGSIESWNNRFRISNICIFDSAARGKGTGRLLMEAIEREAAASGARMIVLETQSCNEAAIAFYRKNGFSVIGFDLYAFSNTDPERHEVRIEMGKKLHGPSVR